MSEQARIARQPFPAVRLFTATVLAAALLGCAAPTQSPPAAAPKQPAPAQAAPNPASSAAQSPAAPAASASAPATAGPAQKVTMGVPAKSLNYLPLYLGQEKGIFAEEGIDLELSVMQTEVTIAGAISGSLDYSGSTTGVVRAAITGAPVRALGFMSIQPTFYIMSKPEIRTMAGLRGKTIATASPGSSTTMIAREGVRRAGLDPSTDVQILTTGTTSNAFTALISGQADGAVLSVPFNVQAEREGFYPLLYAGDITSTPESGVSASLDKIRSSPDEARRVLRGTLKSLKYMREHKAETIAMIVRDFGVEEDLADGAYELMMRSYSKDGGIPNAAIEHTIDDLRAQQGISQTFTVDDVTDYTILRQVQRELGL